MQQAKLEAGSKITLSNIGCVINAAFRITITDTSAARRMLGRCERNSAGHSKSALTS